jgi:hypothetical protein
MREATMTDAEYEAAYFSGIEEESKRAGLVHQFCTKNENKPEVTIEEYKEYYNKCLDEKVLYADVYQEQFFIPELCLGCIHYKSSNRYCAFYGHKAPLEINTGKIENKLHFFAILERYAARRGKPQVDNDEDDFEGEEDVGVGCEHYQREAAPAPA